MVANGQEGNAVAFVDLPEQLEVDDWVSWAKRFSGLIFVYIVAGLILVLGVGLFLYFILKIRKEGLKYNDY